LAASDGSLGGCELLLWLTGSNGALDDDRPADFLETDIDDVLEGRLVASETPAD
jgi:hypothetical protein